MHSGAANGSPDGVTFVRALDYDLGGDRVRATDVVDVSLVRPRPRKYETAGAASGAEPGRRGEGSKAPEKTGPADRPASA